MKLNLKTYNSLALLGLACIVAACQNRHPQEPRAMAGQPAARHPRYHMMAGPTGSVPRFVSRTLSGNGETGSLTCEFLGTPTPATKWWTGSGSTKWNVSKEPGTPVITGYPKGQRVTVYFSSTTATAPSPTTVQIIADKTIALKIQYK